MESPLDSKIRQVQQTNQHLRTLFGDSSIPGKLLVGTSVTELLGEASGTSTSVGALVAPTPLEHFISLGFPKTIDRIMKGGIPAGTVAELTGPSGVGKTRLALHIAASRSLSSANMPDHNKDADVTHQATSSRVLLVDADRTSPTQGGTLLSSIEYLSLQGHVDEAHDRVISEALNAVHVLPLKEIVLLPGPGHYTTQKHTLAAFVKALYRHVVVNPQCKLIIIDSFTSLMEQLTFPTVSGADTGIDADNKPWSFATKGSQQGFSSKATGNFELLHTQTLIQELKQLSEIFHCAIIIVTHAVPHSSTGAEISRNSGGLTMFHAVNTRLVLQWEPSDASVFRGQPTVLPSVNNLVGFKVPDPTCGPMRILTVAKSPVCLTPVSFSIEEVGGGWGAAGGSVRDPTLVAKVTPQRR